MKKVIITDEDNKPMAWCRDQLCYCTDETWRDEHFPVKPYSIQTARRYIKKSIEFRTNAGFLVGGYRLMPIKIR